MWAERERWRQRVRVGVFVVAVCTLVIAWWRYERDPRSMPGLFSPIDSWLGDTPTTNRPAPSTATAGPDWRQRRTRSRTRPAASGQPGGVAVLVPLPTGLAHQLAGPSCQVLPAPDASPTTTNP